MVSPEPQAPRGFELPFDVHETHQYQLVRMTRERSRLDFTLDVQPASTAILGASLDSVATLQQPLGAHAHAAGRYLPGVLVPVLPASAPIVLGALPTTLEYNFHGLDWRNPVTGGLLGSLELSGLPMNQWQLGGLDASNRASGGSGVRWRRPKMPNRISCAVGLQWQPQDSLMLTDNAQSALERPASRWHSVCPFKRTSSGSGWMHTCETARSIASGVAPRINTFKGDREGRCDLAAKC